MPRSGWKRFEAGEVCDAHGIHQVECAYCQLNVDPDELVYSRGDVDSDEPVYCSTGCGVVHERKMRERAQEIALQGGSR